MKVVFASRTGNVQSIVDRLSVDALEISSGDEAVSEPFLLITYTDGYGDVPMEVESFLNSNGDHLKGVIVSGDQDTVKHSVKLVTLLLNNTMFLVFTKLRMMELMKI